MAIICKIYLTAKYNGICLIAKKVSMLLYLSYFSYIKKATD